MTNKKARTVQEQIVLLKDRGLQIKEEQIAASYLEHISYYRLKGYWWNMQENPEQHIFKPGSCFEDVIERYNFDRELRQILFDAIEVIEVSLRANLINCMSCDCSQEGLWYLSPDFFEREDYLSHNLEKLRREFARSQEVFAKDFREKHPSKYKDHWESDANPDAWLILETATFGTLSKIYKNLKHQLPQKAKIANKMGFYSHKDLSSCLEAVANIRNIVAHHARIWGRTMVKRPAYPLKTVHPFVIDFKSMQDRKPFYIMSVMLYMSKVINPQCAFKEKLIGLFDRYPNIPLRLLGFTEFWRNEPVWS